MRDGFKSKFKAMKENGESTTIAGKLDGIDNIEAVLPSDDESQPLDDEEVDPVGDILDMEVDEEIKERFEIKGVIEKVRQVVFTF